MVKIRILPDRVANQIAAGEVIERPAAVIKELVENSIDAGATQIEVEFRHGGRSLMRVTDNGSGMSRDNALLSLERHATSKLSEATDLDRLSTFGFRGEAVPSIASVSRFEMQTRTDEQEAGTEILVNGGKFVHVRDCGRPKGTQIVVAHLFNSVPARRKFLKSDSTESAHIIHCVRLYALSCPQTAFTLIEDDRLIFRSPNCATLEERVAEIFGRQLTQGLLPVLVEEGEFKLSGLIGRPTVSRPTRHEMTTFINRRPVDSRTLNYALIESYHEVIPKGRYPIAFLFLELDPASVDVNVHPAKREVRFRDEGQVRSFVIRSLLRLLRPAPDAGPRVDSETLVRPSPDGPSVGSPIPPTARVESKIAAPFTAFRVIPPVIPVYLPSVPEGIAAPAQPISIPLRARLDWRFLTFVHGSYLLFETAAGIVCLDRRAAYDRIWFERLDGQFKEGKIESQRLLLPIPIELPAVSSAVLSEKLAFLLRHGVEVVEFGRNFFRIEAVPSWLEPGAAEGFLLDVLGGFREGRIDERNPALAREEVARLATARAVRLGETVNAVEAQALITELFQCRQPLTTPAGRPTFFEISQGEFNRRLQK